MSEPGSPAGRVSGDRAPVSVPASHIGWLSAAAALCVAVLAGSGIVGSDDLLAGLATLWRPSVAILSIMVSTSAAQHLGILDMIAARIAPGTDRSPAQVFRSAFVMSAVTAAILNNDAAILLLTPLVVILVRRCYPERPDLVVPFAFAVFAAAGVAPLMTSNPMNLIVADYLGIGFNEYALRMTPVAVAGWLATYGVLRILFRVPLREAAGRTGAGPYWHQRLPLPARSFLAVLVLSLACYPALSFFGWPVWPIAAGIAMLGTGLCWGSRSASPRRLAATVSWPIMIFLYCVFVIVLGMRNAGVVDFLAALYASPTGDTARIALIGVVSAMGSAVLNNHPMAILNALAIQGTGAWTHQQVLAALIGGDLGPRLLPMGSLAGLLWFDSLRRLDVHPGLVRFVRIGVAVTVPALAVSLAVVLLSPP